MSAAPKVTEMAKFKLREPKAEYRVLVVHSTAEDLEQIARIRTAVNKAVGDGTTISVTSMFVEEGEELVEQQFEEWGGKPLDPSAETKLIEKLIAEYKPAASRKPKKK